MLNISQILSNSRRIIIAKVLAIVGSGIVLLAGIVWTFPAIDCFKSGLCMGEPENGMIPLILMYCYIFGAMGLIEGFNPTKNKIRLIIIGVLTFPFGGVGLLLIISSLLAPKTCIGKSDRTRAEKLGRLEEMVQADRLETALPEIYKLSRANPDDPRVRELFRRVRARQQESQR